MSTPDTGRNGIKTTAIRFKPDVHAQITTIADLRGHTLQDEVMTAIEAHIEAAKTDPALLEKVKEAQAEIEQEARERRATIDGLFAGPAPTKAPARPAKASGPRPGARP